MPYCCVPHCCNSGIKVKKGDINVTFHHFPKDEVRKKEWIIGIRRDEGQDFKVCVFYELLN